MSACAIDIFSHLRPVVEYSGKFFQYMGQYEQCLQDESMRYNLVYLAMTGQTTDLGKIGLCLPASCQKDQVSQVINSFFKSVSYPFQVSHINNQLPYYQYQYSWAYYLTSVIIVSLVFLFVYSSLTKPKNNLLAFSVQQTVKIFKRNPNSDLNVLNGVRSLAMMWVVIGHMFTSMIGGTTNVSTSVEKQSFLKPFFLFIQAGLFSVDVFFFIGGLLVAYVMLKDTNKSDLKYPLAIVQRVLRFWPSYFFTILFYYSFYKHLGSGPSWDTDTWNVQMCDKMWKPLFFVDNLVDNGQKPCLGWGWYLQNDMQLFIFSIVLLYFYRLKPLIVKIIIWPLVIGSLIYTFVWTFQHQTVVITHLNDVEKWGTYFGDVYVKPWARAPPYLLGLFFGILHYELSQIKKLKKMTLQDNQQNGEINESIVEKIQSLLNKKRYIRIITQWFGILLMLFLVLIPRTLQVGMQWSQFEHSLYQATGKFFFVLALYLTILPSLLGCKSSIIRFSLDTEFWNIIAKISFCTYLIHLIIVGIWLYSRTYSRYFTTIPTWAEYSGILVISMTCGLIMTFLIEVPCSKLQKSLMGFVKDKLSNNKSVKNQDTKELNQTLLSTDENIRIQQKEEK